MINNAILYRRIKVYLPVVLNIYYVYSNDVLCKVLHNCVLYSEIDDHLEIKEKSITVNGKSYLYT